MPASLRILTYPGIGDFSWCYSKLVNLGRPLEVVYRVPARVKNPGGAVHHRLKPLLSLLPLVKSERHEALPPSLLDGDAPTIQELHSVSRTHFAINAHLEAGKRIEEYVPELPTSFHYELNRDPKHIREANELLKGKRDYLLIYPSAKQNVENWKGWGPKRWAEFVHLYRKKHGPTPVVVTGAAWDSQLANHVTKQIGNDVTNLAGRTILGTTVELIRRSRYFVSFPSGLAVLATVIRSPVYMFYPSHLEPMMFAWADPADIESKRYLASLWQEPEKVLVPVSNYLETQTDGKEKHEEH